MFSKIRLIRYLTKKYKSIKICRRKATARNPYSIEVTEKGERKYVVVACNDVQKFYLSRSIKKQREFMEEYKGYFEFILPEEVKEIYGLMVVVYPYVNNLSKTHDDKAEKFMEKLYAEYGEIIDVTEEAIDRIIEDLLDAWPSKYHDIFKREDVFNEFVEQIRSEKKLILYKEHGDFNCENVLTNFTSYYLMDFEFAKSHQPIGQDVAEYDASITGIPVKKESMIGLKIRLCDRFNNIVDSCWYRRCVTNLENTILFPIINKMLYKGIMK